MEKDSNLDKLFVEYESNLIEFSKIVVSRLEQFSQTLIDKHNNKQSWDKRKKIENHSTSEKPVNTKNIESRIFSLRKDLNMLQSFKRRKIITYFDKRPIAFTSISIFGDQVTLVDTNSPKSLLRFHSLNIRFSEFLIASRVRSFIDVLQKLAEIMSICAGIVIGASLFYNFEITVPRYDTIEATAFRIAVEIGIPNAITIFGRRIIGGWIAKKILTFALERILKKLDPPKHKESTI